MLAWRLVSSGAQGIWLRPRLCGRAVSGELGVVAAPGGGCGGTVEYDRGQATVLVKQAQQQDRDPAGHADAGSDRQRQLDSQVADEGDRGTA
jgi:hypothetical protein